MATHDMFVTSPRAELPSDASGCILRLAHSRPLGFLVPGVFGASIRCQRAQEATDARRSPAFPRETLLPTNTVSRVQSHFFQVGTSKHHRQGDVAWLARYWFERG